MATRSDVIEVGPAFATGYWQDHKIELSHLHPTKKETKGLVCFYFESKEGATDFRAGLLKGAEMEGLLKAFRNYEDSKFSDFESLISKVKELLPSPESIEERTYYRVCTVRDTTVTGPYEDVDWRKLAETEKRNFFFFTT